MKNFVTISTTILTTLFASSLFANVGVFEGFGHSIELTKTEKIEMVSEEITIVPGRGRFIFDGGVPGFDRVEFYCKFRLKNLENATVNIQVGFPLNAEFFDRPNKIKRKTSDLVARYNFIAQEEGNIYNVRYSPGDREQKLRDLFMWDMRFQPNEEKDLFVTYSMPISTTLASTAKNFEESEYAKEWYLSLENCMLEWFGYVTETGQSWSGPIRNAEFKVYTEGFEEYLLNRPFMEGMNEEEKNKSFERYPVFNPIFFKLTEPVKWHEDDQGFIKLSYENYEADKNLMFYYYLLFFPQDIDDVKRLIIYLFKIDFENDDYEDLRDIFLEFNGKKTSNKRIKKFLENQIWFKEEKQILIPTDVIEFIEDKIG